MASRIREYQDHARNAGWRIRWIDHQPPDQTIRTGLNPIGLVGVATFIAGIVLTLTTQHVSWIWFSLGGVVVALASLALAARRKRAGWIRTRARVIDREIGCAGSRRGMQWSFRLLCELEHDGETYRVTPHHWLSWGRVRSAADRGRSQVERELAGMIDADDTCWLLFNPHNPRECETAARDLRSRLLHPS